MAPSAPSSTTTAVAGAHEQRHLKQPLWCLGQFGQRCLRRWMAWHYPALQRQQLEHHEQRPLNQPYGVWGSSATDVFAVGYRHHPALQRQQLEHHEQRHLKQPSWCLGQLGQRCLRRWRYGTILHYNGGTWGNMSSGT